MGLFGLVIVGTLYDLSFLYYRPKSEHGSLSKFDKNMISILDSSCFNEFLGITYIAFYFNLHFFK